VQTGASVPVGAFEDGTRRSEAGPVDPLSAPSTGRIVVHAVGVSVTEGRYSVEVSSPGRERPLTKPEHFQRFVGRRARVRTSPSAGIAPEHSVTGELIGATASEVTLAAPDGVVAIPYAAIQRSHLVEE